MLELKDVISKQILTNLLSVDFKVAPKTNSNQEPELDYYDEVEISELTDDKVNFHITRYVKFIPESFFNIEIKFSVERYLNEDLEGKVKLSDYDILNDFKKHSQFYTDYEESWLSMIISQLTSAFGNSPLVTPPLICLNNE